MCVCLNALPEMIQTVRPVFVVCMCWNCRLAAVFISFMQLLIFQHNCLYIFILCGTISCQEKEKFGHLMCFFFGARFLIEIVGTLTTAKIHNHFSRIFDIIIYLGWLNQDWIDCIISPLLSLALSLSFSVCSKGIFLCHRKLNFSKAIYITNAIAFASKFHAPNFPNAHLETAIYAELKRKRRRRKKELYTRTINCF